MNTVHHDTFEAKALDEAKAKQMEQAIGAGCTEDEACAVSEIERDEWIAHVATKPPGYVERLQRGLIANEARKKLYTARVSRNADRLLDAQLSLARGQQFLYVQRKNEDGENEGRPELVTDPETIADFLDGNMRGDGRTIDGDDWYFVTTKEPQMKAITDALDRVHGKATEHIDHTSGGERIRFDFTPEVAAASAAMDEAVKKQLYDK